MSSYSTSGYDLLIPEYSSSKEGSLSRTVDWLQQELDFSDDYVARLIKVRKDLFLDWKHGNHSLTSSRVNELRSFSSTLTRLLSFVNFRRDLMMKILEFESDQRQQYHTALTPPWLGTSLKRYMMEHGARGVQEVDAWVQAMRLADSF